MDGLQTDMNSIARAVFALAAATLLSPLEAAATTEVERGEYLTRAGDCIGCHTAPGGVPLAGGLRVDTPFGYMLSPNITPDVETGIGQYTSDEFYRALHAGIKRNGEDMYPTMPYDFYTKVTRADVDAIYAYLRSVPPVRNNVKVNHLAFPFDLRFTMAGWRELYFREGAFGADPAGSAQWNRGAYLVEGLGHCSDCHSPRNLMGAIEKSRDLTGAVVDGWFAQNLTSDIATGLGAWSVDDIATYLKTGAIKGKTTTLGPMAVVIQNSLKYMTDDDLKAMAVYLKAIPPDSRLRRGVPLPSADRARGASLYVANCIGCHQSSGRGIPGVFPPLARNPVVVGREPNDIVKVIDNGIPGRGTYPAMPGFKIQLTDEQVADLANYLRTNWGNSAEPNATSNLVGKLRAGPQ
jgi:mono/diheme cytochrome c family protein